jgi:hypothetical protein
MALTEIQLLMGGKVTAADSKLVLYSILQDAAADLSSSMNKMKLVANFINRMETDDLDALQVPAGKIRADMTNLKTVLNYFVALWGNQAVTPAVNPVTVVDAIRRANQG